MPTQMPDLRSHNHSRSQPRSILASAPGLEAAEVLFDTIGDVLFCMKDRMRR